MNRQRKTNRGLPRRVYLKHGAYYYVSTEPIRCPATQELKKWIRLADVDAGEAAMLTALGLLLGGNALVEGSMPYLCKEFKAHKLGEYGDETRDTYGRYLDLIAKEFSEFHASQVTTKDCADFLRIQFKGKSNTAQKYTALMGKVFRYAIGELGLRQDNPVDQLDSSNYKTKRRTVLPTHEQIQLIRAAGMQSKERAGTKTTFATASGPMFACIIDISYLLWARAIDIRLLKESQIENGRIRIKPSKTVKTSGKMVDITITPAIQDVIDRARALKRKYEVISPYVFPTQKGGAYSKSGLSSMWRRAKDRLGIKEDIIFKDIRALGATDAAKAGESRKDIQTRLVHTSGKTTDIYIKEAIADVSDIEMSLPWSEKN
jgi:integrase